MKDFFHVLNPNKKKAHRVRSFFEKNRHLEHMWVERISHPTHLETIVQWAINEGRRKIAVWGGDGTLNRVAQTLYDFNALQRVTIALIPAGTCNDFARFLQLPAWQKEAQLALSSRGSERAFDVGLLGLAGSKRVFINNAGFGRTPSAIGRKSNAIRDIFSFTEKKLDMEWKLNEARQFETRSALLGIVFNAPYFNGGMYFEKSIQPDDGVLNGFFENPQSCVKLLLKFARSRFGRSLNGPRTFRVDFQSLRFESDRDVFPQVDGEAASSIPVRFLDFSILPKSLRMILWR